MDREQDQVVIFAQGVEQGPFTLFQGDGHGLAVKALSQGLGPVIDGLGGVGQGGLFQVVLAGLFETDGMGPIGPIDADQGDECRLLSGLHGAPPPAAGGWA